LFVPENKVSFTGSEISAMADMSYQERALYILKHYLTDYSDEEIADCVYNAYTDEKFDDKELLPWFS